VGDRTTLLHSFIQTEIDATTAKQGFAFYLCVGRNKSGAKSRKTIDKECQVYNSRLTVEKKFQKKLDRLGKTCYGIKGEAKEMQRGSR